jgi:hypothetical protein
VTFPVTSPVTVPARVPPAGIVAPFVRVTVPAAEVVKSKPGPIVTSDREYATFLKVSHGSAKAIPTNIAIAMRLRIEIVSFFIIFTNQLVDIKIRLRRKELKGILKL